MFHCHFFFLYLQLGIINVIFEMLRYLVFNLSLRLWVCLPLIGGIVLTPCCANRKQGKGKSGVPWGQLLGQGPGPGQEMWSDFGSCPCSMAASRCVSVHAPTKPPITKLLVSNNSLWATLRCHFLVRILLPHNSSLLRATFV